MKKYLYCYQKYNLYVLSKICINFIASIHLTSWRLFFTENVMMQMLILLIIFIEG